MQVRPGDLLDTEAFDNQQKALEFMTKLAEDLVASDLKLDQIKLEK